MSKFKSHLLDEFTNVVTEMARDINDSEILPSIKNQLQNTIDDFSKLTNMINEKFEQMVNSSIDKFSENVKFMNEKYQETYNLLKKVSPEYTNILNEISGYADTMNYYVKNSDQMEKIKQINSKLEEINKILDDLSKHESTHNQNIQSNQKELNKKLDYTIKQIENFSDNYYSKTMEQLNMLDSNIKSSLDNISKNEIASVKDLIISNYKQSLAEIDAIKQKESEIEQKILNLEQKLDNYESETLKKFDSLFNILVNHGKSLKTSKYLIIGFGLASIICMIILKFI